MDRGFVLTLLQSNMETRENLIRMIQEFVGEGGYVAFEHGYKPTMAIYGVGYDYVDRRMFKGKDRKGYFQDMNTQALQNIVNELFNYYNYCHLYA